MRKYLLPSPDVDRSTTIAQKTDDGEKKGSNPKSRSLAESEISRRRSNCDRRVGGTIQFGTDRRRVSGAMRRRVAVPLMRDRGERAGSRLRAQSDNAETGEASTLDPRLSTLDKARQGKARQGKARQESGARYQCGRRRQARNGTRSASRPGDRATRRATFRLIFKSTAKHGASAPRLF